MPKTIFVQVPDDVDTQEMHGFYNELSITTRCYALSFGKIVADLALNAAIEKRIHFTYEEREKILYNIEDVMRTMALENRNDLIKQNRRNRNL